MKDRYTVGLLSPKWSAPDEIASFRVRADAEEFARMKSLQMIGDRWIVQDTMNRDRSKTWSAGQQVTT